jgi:hypothetical protein
LSTDDEIAEVFYSDIQEKTNIVKQRSGILPFLSDNGNFDPENPDYLDGFQVVNLYDGITSSDDRQMLNNLYCQVLEEEQEEAGESEDE